MKKIVLLLFLVSSLICFTSFKTASAAQVDKINLGGLLQFWYQLEDTSAPRDFFLVRRAEIQLDGKINPDISWLIRIDPLWEAEQDFLITYKAHKYLTVDLGQYKIPFGMEGLKSSSKLDFVERSMMSSLLGWSDTRDIGISFKSELEDRSVKLIPVLGIFNGEWQNRYNEAMDIVARAVIKPNDKLHIGLAHYSGRSTIAEVERVYTGIEFKYVDEYHSVYGEYASGESDEQNRVVYYGAGTYSISKNIQAALRFDYYDSNTDAPGGSITETTLGINYFFENNGARAQINYVLRGEEGDAQNNDVVRLNFQIVY